MNHISRTIAIGLTVAGLTGATSAFAQESATAKQPASATNMQEMMKGLPDNGGTGTMGMMPMMGMMSQMKEMMTNCNKMMEAMTTNMPSGANKKPENKG